MKNESNRFRIVQYITFEPAQENDSRQIEDRVEAFRMRSTNSKAEQDLQGFPFPQLTQLGEKILGLRSWQTNEIIYFNK